MRLSSFRTNRILTSLCKNNRKPLLRFMRKLMADKKPDRPWTDVEYLFLKSIVYFCFENGFISDAQWLIKLVGFELLLVLPDSVFPIQGMLVEKGEESFVLETFSAIEQCGLLSKLSLAESKLLLTAMFL